MIDPATGLVIFAITGLGGVVTYSAFRYAEKAGKEVSMKTEAERKSFHERIFGKGSTPPGGRLGRGQALNDLMPMPPEEGPPLPRMLALRWPWKR